MSLQGQHLEPLAPISSEFLQYQTLFGDRKLVKLYKITYEAVGVRSLEPFNLNPSIFFHGTGHCGCVCSRSVENELTKIIANNWCGMANCATQGILNHGHMRAYSRGGHFFSPHWETAQGYSIQKSGQQGYLSLFLVKVRDSNLHVLNVCSVANDVDILPCYLALLRYP